MKTCCWVALFAVGFLGMPASGQHLPESEQREVEAPSVPPPLVSAPDSADETPAWAPSPVTPPRTPRYRRGAHIPLGILLGGGGMLAGGMAGYYLASSVTGCDTSSCERDTERTVSVGVGVAVGAATGVYLTGRWLRGQGGFGYTLLGAALGAVPSALMLTSDSDDVAVLGGVSLIVTPIVGSLFGFGLSHSATVRASEQGFLSQAVVVPTLGRTREGSLFSGLAGRF
ncbi:hypothetical protein ACN469_21210 [Corallococcus terminator]